jgi:hypothetical protein
VVLERAGHDESPSEAPNAAGATDELIDRLIALLELVAQCTAVVCSRGAIKIEALIKLIKG